MLRGWGLGLLVDLFLCRGRPQLRVSRFTFLAETLFSKTWLTTRCKARRERQSRVSRFIFGQKLVNNSVQVATEASVAIFEIHFSAKPG